MITTRGTNGTLWIDIPAKQSPTGKRIRCSAKTTNMERAKEIEAQLLNQYVSLEMLEKEAQIEHFNNFSEPKMQSRIGDELMQMLGALTNIKSIDNETIRGLTSALREKGNQNSTINRKLSHLSKILSLAVDWGYINVVPRIKSLKENNGRELIVDKETELNIIQALLDYESPTHKKKWEETADLVAVLFDTGAKLSEVLKMKPHQVNFENNTLTFSGRNNQSSKARTIPMTERVATILKARNCQWTLTKYGVSPRWKSAVIELGIYEPEMVLQVCRRSCAARLIAGGMGIYEVSEWLGASVATIERYGYKLTDQLSKGTGILQNCQIQ